MRNYAWRGTPLTQLLVGEAQLRADASRHVETTPLHLSAALVERPEVARILASAGVDADAVATRHSAALAALPTSGGKVAEVRLTLLRVMERAARRAAVPGARDLLGSLSEDSSEPFGEALWGAPRALEEISAWLGELEREIDPRSEMRLEGFSASRMFFQSAQQIADAHGSALVLPLHVLAARAEFRLRNAEKLGLVGAEGPALAANEAILRLPRRATGHAVVSLALLAVVRAARLAANGPTVDGIALLAALQQESRSGTRSNCHA